MPSAHVIEALGCILGAGAAAAAAAAPVGSCACYVDVESDCAAFSTDINSINDINSIKSCRIISDNDLEWGVRVCLALIVALDTARLFFPGAHHRRLAEAQ
jgi:hypothetical protein